MKLAFIFDVAFAKYNDQYYSVNLSQKFWKDRYLPYFDEIVVIGREKTVTEDPTGKMVRSDSNKVHFCCMPNGNRINRMFSLNKENKFIEEAIADCDFVVCRSWWGVSVCEKLNKKYMIEVITCAWDGMWNHSRIGRFLAVPYYLNQRKAIKKAPYALYVTEEFLQGRYPCKGVSVGVSDVMLKNISDDTVLEKRLERIDASSEKILLGTAAAVNVKYKGQRFVIEALHILKSKGYDCFRYQLAGGGDNSDLKKLVDKYDLNDVVEFLGSVPQDKIHDWYESLDMYVQPSLQEGLPRSVVEAMSHAIPCVCMKTGGMPELVEPEYICTKRGNKAKTIANKLLLMKNKENMKKAAQYNFARSKNYYPEVLDTRRKDFMKRFINQEK